jgi:murein DD-endopeptidase MepM/ murein hydrolase activator NlpD
MRLRKVARTGPSGAGFLNRLLPDRSVTVRCPQGVRCHHLSPSVQAAGLAAGLFVALWMIVATSGLALQGLGAAAGDDAEVSLPAAFEARIAELETELARAETARAEAERRASAAAGELAARHDALAAAAAREAALRSRAMSQAETVAALTRERDAAREAETAAQRAKSDALAMLDEAASERDELSETLLRIANALDATAVARDDAQAAAREASGALGALASDVEQERDRQARVLAEVEKAAELSIAPLEKMLRAAGVDVDSVIDKLRDGDGGAGGPFIPASLGDVAEDPTSAKAMDVIADLDRVRLLRKAAVRMPFASPLRTPRFTSSYGVRRDPINGRMAMHEGLDMPGPRGTPVMAPAEGVVTFAGTQRGYGRVVKIRHDFGFETVYAHLNRIRVQKGERVAVGHRIGDMGSTGRSTGPHLHYEIRVNGKPVNPTKFIKASRDVL